MTAKEISRFLSAGLCLAVLLIASVMGAAGLAQLSGQSYSNPHSLSIPQNAQERADVFKVIMSQGDEREDEGAQVLASPYLYSLLQNPYSFDDPQAKLERQNAYKALQKRNGAYNSISEPDNWYYWTNMWLNDPSGADMGSYTYNISQGALSPSDVYHVMDNPYAYTDPQAHLEEKNTYKALQKWNNAYYGAGNPDNWYYWTDMWLSD
jgi:hypothetical protein